MSEKFLNHGWSILRCLFCNDILNIHLYDLLVVAVPVVVSVASAVYDQVSQLVPVQQVDDIDEVHQLDPVHQVDHKDECSKISLQKKHHKMDQPGLTKKSNFFFKVPETFLGV